jgi:F-type H+-transporting ATPase subunit delta
MKKLPVSTRYARALSDMAYRDKLEDVIMKDIDYILSVIKSSKELVVLIKSPVVSNHKKKAIISEIFVNNVSKLMSEFLTLLINKSRESLIWDIFDNYKHEYYESHNMLQVIISSVHTMNDELKEMIIEKVHEITNKTILPEFKIEKNIIGGFKIQFSDIIIDSSIRTKIDKLHKHLLMAEN